MARKPEITELPTRFLMQRLGSGRRWKQIIAGAVVLVGAAGYGAYYLLQKVETNQSSTFQHQWASLQGCTLGDPLKPGELPSARVRGIQLTVVGTPREKRAAPGEVGWPVTCATFASALAQHADTLEHGGTELKASANALAKQMRENGNASNDMGKLVDEVWKDAEFAGLKAEPSNGAATPKPTAALYPKDILKAPSGLGGEFAVTSLKPEGSPSKSLRFLIDDVGLVGGAAFCSAAGVPTVLTCAHVGPEPAKHTPGLSLWGMTDPETRPWIFAGDKGQLGIFRPTGPAVLTGDMAMGSTVDKDGSAWLLIHPAAGAANELRLIHAPATGDLPKGSQVLESEVENAIDATLVGDWIIDRTGPKAKTPLHLVGHKVSEKGELGPAVDIGDATNLDRPDPNDTTPRFSMCKNGSNAAVHVHGVKGDAISFFTGSVWSAPVPITTRGGTILCRGNEAVVTQITRVVDIDGSHPTVDESRCNASGCTAARLAIRDVLVGTDVVPLESGSFSAADINGKLLLVWNAGPLGGLRMRFAPINQIMTTPDTLIVDAREDSGVTPITEVRVIAAADFALLFVNTTTGPRIFSVDSSGKLADLHTHL